MNLLEKFLETQKIGVIISELTALFVAYQSYLKFKNTIRKDQKKEFKKSLDVDDLLIKLDADLDDKFIPAVAVVSNGGDFIKSETPKYIQAINCTYDSVMSLFGEKMALVKTIKDAVYSLIDDDYSYFDIEDVNLRKVEFWAGAKSIERTHYFRIGSKKYGLYILALNSHDREALTDEQMLIASTYADKIKDAFNQNKRFFETKMK